MPATEPTMIHYSWPDGGPAACGAQYDLLRMSRDPGEVTCFICRRTYVFLDAQRYDTPVKLSGVMAGTPEFQALAHELEIRFIVKQGLNSGSNDGEHEALTDLANALGLTYDEDTDTYS